MVGIQCARNGMLGGNSPSPTRGHPGGGGGGAWVSSAVSTPTLLTKKKKKKGIKVDRDTKNINETHLKWHLVHLQVSQVSEMAHDSSLLLAPGSQKDLEKKNHKQKQAGVQAETTVSLSPPRGLPLWILHHPQQPGVLTSTDKTQLRWPVVKINFDRPVTANPVC